MGRRDRNKVTAKNPATKFLTWASDGHEPGTFAYWDGEKNVPVELPFNILIIWQKASIVGFDKANKTGVKSNEIDPFKSKSEKFLVKNYNGDILFDGLYDDIKGSFGTDIHWASSLYGMTPDGDIVNLKLKGLPLGRFAEFTKKKQTQMEDQFIAVETFTKEKNGSNRFTSPVFTWGTSLTAEQEARAEEIDKLLEDYFNGDSPSDPGAYIPHEEEEEDASSADDDKDLPF